MRNFLFVMQIVALILLVYETGFVFIKLKTGLQKYLFATSFSTLLNSLGYFVAIQATDINEYLAGLKLSYVGRVWVPFSFLLLILSICKKKINKTLFVCLSLIHLSVIVLVMTCNYHSLYYKNIVFDTSGIFPCINKDEGIFYILYHSLILIYIVYGVFLLIKSVIKEKNPIQKKRISLILAAVVAESLFYFIEVYGYTVGFDDTVLGYAIGSVFMFIAIFKYSLLDNLKIARDYVIEEVSEGIIVADRNGEVEYFNTPAKNYLPQLENNPTHALTIINDALLLKKPLRMGENIYELKKRELLDDGTAAGTIYVLIDDTEHQKYTDMIKKYNHNLESEVTIKTRKIREIQQRIILGMAQMVESRDLSTGGHIKRTSLVVSVFSKALLKSEMGFTPQFLQYVERSAPMHDLGKIAVNDSILRKQGKFTDEEYEIMKKHSAAGAKIVSDILTGIEEEEFVKIAINVAHYHHEKVNGKGYPEGLKGNEIPVEARIMALADVFDALVSKRCYKDAFSFDRAFNIIKEDSGSHFDAELAEIFIKCREELEALYNSFEE